MNLQREAKLQQDMTNQTEFKFLGQNESSEYHFLKQTGLKFWRKTILFSRDGLEILAQDNLIQPYLKSNSAE